MIQIFIFLFSAAAIWFVGRKEHWSKWGYIFGICSQPFWLYNAYIHQDWGIFLLSLFYGYCWMQGVYNFWIKDETIKN